MKQRMIVAFVVAGVVLLTTGCKSLFPSKISMVESRWKSYAEVQSDFAKIIPDRSGTNELRSLGFDPGITPNIKVLTYVDVIQIFMPNPGIHLKTCPKAFANALRDANKATLIKLICRATIPTGMATSFLTY